jgi:alkanesulfonate monooxygenase SsuD/methylene tetrahydromethanopterin reductase-like flavin-dependent oxidoreductase (luciferase family)
MRYGINLPPFEDFADAAALAELARKAEAAGWDGFFIWDHVVFDPSWYPIADPWVALTAVALKTSTIHFGTMITPLARRRPWQLARQTATLDRLSGGRLILGVGLGDPVQWDFGFFGEETDARLRAQRLDEGLAVLTGLWSGEPFAYEGNHYRLQEMRFRPTPLQTPRIPIWVAGWWPHKPPLRRAARWDGVVPGKLDAVLTPEEVREIVAYVAAHRAGDAPFEVVVSGTTPGADPAAGAATVAPLAQAGATWWIEVVDPWSFGWKWEEPWTAEASAKMRERVGQGPPRGHGATRR